ncbi:MAG: hypothetical protein FJ298_07705 [Planctomycetes bacterium]|nr:hypothetical protein [Planctomycetota bacterium]
MKSGTSASERAWLGPLVVVLVALAMAAWTWRAWAEPIVDFGGEAYVAWRISQGDVLYRDLAYFTGPLAPYLHGAAMSACGASLTTIAALNFLLLGATLTLLWRLARRMSDAFAATCACVAFTILCAFGLHKGGGNYNFIWPYSQEMPLGFLLSLAALATLVRWIEAPSRARAALLGLFYGLVFLTKLEFTVALGGALLLGLASSRTSTRERLEHSACALVAALAPVALAWGLLCTELPARGALEGVLGAWTHAFDARTSDFPLYRYSMGIEPLGFHLGRIALWSLGGCTLVVLVSWLALRKGAVLASGVSLAIVVALFAALSWNDALYPLSFFALGALGATWRSRASSPESALRTVWSGFSLLLLLRMALNARVEFYGFALAAPGLVALVVALVGWLPGRFPQARNALRAATLPLVAALVLGHLFPMAVARRTSTVELLRGGDRMLTHPGATFLQEAIDLAAERCPESGSLLVLPEGALVNYGARRRAPTAYFNYMPPEVAMFGEEAMLDALKASPPDAVVLIHRSTAEYGVPFFGTHYGTHLYAWVRERYRPVKLWSFDPKERPFEPGTRHAIALLEPRK